MYVVELLVLLACLIGLATFVIRNPPLRLSLKHDEVLICSLATKLYHTVWSGGINTRLPGQQLGSSQRRSATSMRIENTAQLF